MSTPHRTFDSGQIAELKTFTQKALILARQLLGLQAEAEDVVQASLVKVLDHPSAPAGGVDLQKWLYRVVRNASIDRIRDRQRHISSDADEVIEESATPSYEPEKRLEQAQLSANLKHALGQLSAQHREMVLLRDYHGCSYEEIAEIVGISSGTVMSRLHRGRCALRELLLKSEIIE